jgi:hypothetical protein
MLSVLQKQLIVLGPAGLYAVEIHSDFTIILHSPSTYLDEALFEQVVGTQPVKRDGMSALKLFRAVERFVIAFLYEHRPPYLRYDTGGEPARSRLYQRLARKFRDHGYHLVDVGSDQQFLILRDPDG